MIDPSSRMVNRNMSDGQLMKVKRLLAGSETYKALRTMWHNRATVEALRGNLALAEFFEEVATFDHKDLEHAMDRGEVWTPNTIDPNPGTTGVGAPIAVE